MNEFYTYFILFSSAFIGGLAVILFRLKFSTNLKLLISYSGALILAICILHLIPEIFSLGNRVKTSLSIMLNIAIFTLFTSFIRYGFVKG